MRHVFACARGLHVYSRVRVRVCAAQVLEALCGALPAARLLLRRLALPPDTALRLVLLLGLSQVRAREPPGPQRLSMCMCVACICL